MVAVNAPSRHLFPLFLEWKEMGHEVLVAVDSSVGRLGNAETYHRQGLETLTVLRPRLGRKRHGELSVRQFFSHIRRSDALVVGGYASRSALTALALPRRLRPPTVILAERPDHRTTGSRRTARDTIVKWAIGRSDAVWAMSANGKSAFEALGAMVPVVAPYPLPSQSPLSTTSPSTQTEDAVISVVGRLDDGKNPLAAAAVLRLLNENGFHFTATFFGDGPLRDELSTAIAGLPVRLAGHVAPAEIDLALAASDILLHTCRYDGWGMVVAEAVRAGVAVVAGDGTDSACEFSRLGQTVSIVEMTTEAFALEVVRLTELIRSPEGPTLLEQTRLAAIQHAGLKSVAERTLADLAGRLRT